SRNVSEETQLILPPLVLFFAFLSLLVVAYLTHQQPIIFPRYGLILFKLGLPLLACAFLNVIEKGPRVAPRVLVCIIVICTLDASIELAGAAGTIKQYRAQRAVADYLRAHFAQKTNARIFCDEGTVQALSGIPTERFVTSAAAPKSQSEFFRFLREKEITYLVFIKKQDSVPGQLFPDLESKEPDGFDLVVHSYSDFLPIDIWLYRVR